MEDDKNNSKWKTNKKIKMEADQKKIKWKTTLKIQNGRQPKQVQKEDNKVNQIKDDKKYFKTTKNIKEWKRTQKFRMEDDQNKLE